MGKEIQTVPPAVATTPVATVVAPASPVAAILAYLGPIVFTPIERPKAATKRTVGGFREGETKRDHPDGGTRQDVCVIDFPRLTDGLPRGMRMDRLQGKVRIERWTDKEHMNVQNGKRMLYAISLPLRAMMPTDAEGWALINEVKDEVRNQFKAGGYLAKVGKATAKRTYDEPDME